MTEENWAGRSLAFVRQVKGWHEHYPSAHTARTQSVVNSGVPPIGTVVWFRGGQFGDCALSLGDGRIVGISPQGLPYCTTVGAYENRHRTEYLGWSDELGPPSSS